MPPPDADGAEQSFWVRLTHWLKTIEGVLVSTTSVVVAAGLLYATVTSQFQETPQPRPTLISTQRPPDPTVPATQPPADPTQTSAPTQTLEALPAGTTVEEWAAGADAICREAAPAAQAAVQAWTSGQIDFVTYVHAIGDIAGEIANALGELDAPTDMAVDIELYIDLWQDASQAMRDGATAFMQGDEFGIQEASGRYDRAVLRGLDIAGSLGAFDCVLLGGG